MTTNTEQILDEINGPIRWSLLNCAVKMNLFDLLTGWTAPEQIATQLQLDPEKTILFLDGLTACGYLRKFYNNYLNTDISQQFLVTTAAHYQGNVFLTMSTLRLQDLDQLPQLLKAQQTRTLKLEAEEVWAKAADHLRDYQKSIAPYILSLLQVFQKTKQYHHLLDLGGGPRIVGFSLLQALCSPERKPVRPFFRWLKKARLNRHPTWKGQPSANPISLAGAN